MNNTKRSNAAFARLQIAKNEENVRLSENDENNNSISKQSILNTEKKTKLKESQFMMYFLNQERKNNITRSIHLSAEEVTEEEE